MRKEKYIGLALLTMLCLFAFTIASSTAVATSQTNTVNVNETTSLKAETNFEAVNMNTYTGSGFLYNTVSELRTAYDLNPLYAEGYNGHGETVAIIDAFGDPTIYQDLVSFVAFQNAYGANLPWTTVSQVEQHLHIYYPQGKPKFNNTDPDQLGWSVEITLDVDMVHSIAPGANIALVISYNDSNTAMDYAVNFAIVHHLGCDISQSWGTPEYGYVTPSDFAELRYEHSLYLKAAMEGITCFASSGDWGAANFWTYNNPIYPASDPYVTATGGTNLFMVCNNGTYLEGTGNWINQPSPCVGTSYNYEIAGNDYEAMVADGYPAPFDLVTTGGAMSTLFSLPWWQYGITLTSANGAKVQPTGRCTSDVSFNSGVYGGLGACPWNVTGQNIYYIIGGTSACSPFWAALTAIACQYAHHNLGYINPMLYMSMPLLYKVHAIHDITQGDNTYPTGSTPIGYEATPGWDAPTGIGSPNAALLVPIMAWW